MKAVSNTEAEDVKPNIKTEPDSYTVDQIAMMKAYGIEMSQQVVQVRTGSHVVMEREGLNTLSVSG